MRGPSEAPRQVPTQREIVRDARRQLREVYERLKPVVAEETLVGLELVDEKLAILGHANRPTPTQLQRAKLRAIALAEAPRGSDPDQVWNGLSEATRSMLLRDVGYTVYREG